MWLRRLSRFSDFGSTLLRLSHRGSGILVRLSRRPVWVGDTIAAQLRVRHRRPESLMRLSRLSRRVYYTENDVPQPQVFLALGFANTKPLPLSPSEKSSSVPAR